MLSGLVTTERPPSAEAGHEPGNCLKFNINGILILTLQFTTIIR